MIPLVAAAPELRQTRDELEPLAAQIFEREGVTLSHLEWGTMIELPRAAVTAGEIAEAADFFSFGTNDLTQTAFGFSRDDIGKFVGLYEERKLVPANPFVTIDVPGVGRLMEIACGEGKAANDRLHRAGSAASTAAIRPAWRSATGSGWTTSAARRSASRPHASRRRRPRPASTRPPRPDRLLEVTGITVDEAAA